MDEEQLTEMIIQTKEWYDKKVSQLELISNKDYKIKFQGDDEKQSELPEEHRKGFHLGILTALEILGKFPINISND